ncbi:non-ribosomal peptide synthetase [Micromonospora okii]|uniref:non-ribosomal peptide synthetase n=1 Tax=Micromonospora okii TaxID=1182970 RepID=UPI001E4BC427|nr:non-ribosomal peptide synthetase [Micromonospora okii]
MARVEVTVPSIIDVAREHAARRPHAPAYVFLDDGETEGGRWDYATVDRRARAIAATLRGRGLAGQRVLVAYPSGLDYVQSFLGCLYAGVVAVPCDAPSARNAVQRTAGIRADCTPAAALTSATGQSPPVLAGLDRIDVADVPDAVADDWRDPGLISADLAFLQYTSGSTRNPRGVMVSHGNILANERLIAAACRHDDESTFVGWQPMFHDMGLIANVLQPLYLGSLSVLMAPMAFLQRPMRWLRAVDRYGGHTSGGPNFAYDLCVDNSSEPDREGLDLSRWRVAFNAAEPIREQTLRRFTDTFAPYGFSAETHFPCYGLAEATLLVTGARRNGPPRVRPAASDRLDTDAGVIRSGPDPVASLVSCGPPGLDTHVRVVDPNSGRERAAGEVGEVWVAGPGVASGYWGAPEESAVTFRATVSSLPGRHFLRTGDLGRVLDGELYLTGRRKDVIVIQGQNYHPHDLERDAENADAALRPTCAAAFAVETDGAPRVLLCAELVSYGASRDPDRIAATVAADLLRRHGVRLHALVLLRRGGVPKTTSGKVRRGACRDSYVAGTLPVYAEIPLEPHPVPPPLPDPVELAALNVEAATARLADALLDRAARGLTDRLRTDQPLVATGVDSMRAVALHHAVQERYGVVLGLADLLGDTSVRELAGRVVREAREGLTAAPTVDPPRMAPAAPDGSAPWRPLTERQRGLWFETMLLSDASVHQLARALRLDATVGDERIERALGRLVRRHPALRTGFAVRDGQPGFRIDRDGPVPLWRDAPSSAAELAEALRSEADRPFDLPRERPVRFTVFRLEAGQRVLLMIAHHLVVDFWSLVVLVRDLASELTATGAAAEPAGDPAVAVPPSSDPDRSRRYWRETLDGAPDQLGLPLVGERPQRRSAAGERREFRLPGELTAPLRALARTYGCTVFQVLLSAFQLLLHRYTGQRDLVVGTLLAARQTPELAERVGYLVDLLPIRSRTVGTEAASTFLRRTAGTVRDAIAHADYPYHRMVSDLGRARDALRAPLVQALFVLHREYGGDAEGFRALALDLPARLDLGGVPVDTLPVQRRWSAFDLSLSMAELDGGFAGVWEYRTDLLDAETAAGLTDAFGTLLRRLTDSPDTAVDGLPLVSEEARRDLSASATGSVCRPGRPSALHELVAAAAGRNPDAVAVVDPLRGEHLTYRALHRAAAALARQLHRLGARVDTPVGVLVERSVDLLVADLAVLYAGCTLLPLHVAEPDARLATILAESRPSLLLVQRHVRARAERLGVPTATVAASDSTTEVGGLCRPVSADHTAYLMYTSGSTGGPKGVLVPHGALVNRLVWMQEAYRLAPGERVVHKTPVSFDVSLWELFWPLTVGACVVLAAPDRHADASYLLELVAAEQVHTVHFVPTMLDSFLAAVTARPGWRSALRRVVCSGETLSPALAARALRQLPQARLENLYGPTEAAIDVTSWSCRPDATERVPIGRPIANVECRVLDRRGGWLPGGAVGELYVGGAGLARGYLCRPGLTAERFVPVIGTAAGSRHYRTGDRVRRRPDGTLEFHGRDDHQVKIGGNRVELDEVAATVRRLPNVRDAVALAHPDARGDLYIVAYVTGEVAGPDAAEAVREACRTHLPAYMVPGRVLPLDHLPLTANGKVDRAALPVPGPAAPERRATPPATEREQRLLELWRLHLDTVEVGVTDNFFARGGDSIRALRLVAAAEVVGLRFDLGDLLQHPTVRGLARQLADEWRKEGTGASPGAAPFALCPAAAVRADVADAYPISMGQRALLFQSQHHRSYEIYLTSVAVRDRLDPEALAAAVEGATLRHAYLRSTFDLLSYPEPMQLVHPDMRTALEVVDVRGLAEPTRAARIGQWLREERRRAFDTAAGPLVRFTVHRADQDFRLTVSSFALDGWCDATLLTEILADYALRRDGGGAAIAAPRVEYRDFVTAELAAIRSAEHRRFWQRELAGARVTEVRGLLADGVVASDGDPPGLDDRRHVWTVPRAVAARLDALAGELGVGLKHLLLAVHLQVTAELAGHRDIVTGLQVNGRPERPDGDRCVGMFNNIVPLRVRVAAASWADLARTAYDAEARVAPYRRYPLVELERRFGAAGLFDTLFVFTHFHVYRQLAVSGLEIFGMHAPDQTYLPLTAHFHRGADTDRLHLVLEFDPTRLDRLRVARIGARYRAALAALVVDPEARPPAVSDPGDLPPAEAGPPARSSSPRSRAARMDRLLSRLATLSDEEAAVLADPSAPNPLATERGVAHGRS